ncbi:anthranilate synthase component II [Haladaptatus sp. CMSO5]|uniref:anthranilate synthase component II n=1 Tax=Haladaptatus sp. CMSO5 TaxID=3120514 RepID=UPI002FCE4C2F
MILVIDNYDSFVYNLVQYVGEAVASPYPAAEPQDEGEFHSDVLVKRNDALTIADIRDLDPDGIVVSPGPGTPEEAGISMAIFGELDYPTLGVCLGHQALCAANGAPVGHAPEVIHGKFSQMVHDGEGIYRGLPNPLKVGRYHSLAVRREDLPASLTETAYTEDEHGVVMGVRHVEKPHEGVQFHPESILTDAGKQLIANFIDQCTST